MTTYYMAARPFRADELRSAADDLRRNGQHEVIARWLYDADDTEVHGGKPLEYGTDEANAFALRDFEDIRQADALITFTEERGVPQRGGGRFVEIGYALALGKPVITVGSIEVLFLGLTRVYPDWPSALTAIRKSA